MSTGLKINNGWIYLTKFERERINLIIDSLQQSRTKQVTIDSLANRLNCRPQDMSHYLFILVSVKILRVEQRSRARLFSFADGWKERLRDIITYYGKDLNNLEDIKDANIDNAFEEDEIESLKNN